MLSVLKCFLQVLFLQKFSLCLVFKFLFKKAHFSTLPWTPFCMDTPLRIGKANAVLRELYRYVVTKPELVNTAKFTVFKSVFVPILTYGHESG